MSSLSEQRGRRRKRQRMATVHAQRPSQSFEQQEAEAQGLMGSIGSAVMGGLQRIDDSTQAFARNQLLQLPTDGSMLQEGAFMKGPRNALGAAVFASRKGYEGDNTAYRGTGTTNDNIGLGASRALQGGLITAAGYGLAELTAQFGSQADYQEPNQLSL